MTLENQIKQYLPYNLNCEILDYKSDYVGKQYNTIKGYYMLNEKAYFNFKSGRDIAGKNITQFKPILKPLSDYLCADSETINNLGCDLKDQWMICELANKRTSLNNLNYSTILVMLENHIDMFDLIPKRLAIDYITTL